MNSALQRARATLETRPRSATTPRRCSTRPTASCSSATSTAFEALRHRRAHLADPRGRDAVDAAVRHVARAAATTSSRGGSGPGSAATARGVIPTVAANGSPAFGQYKPSRATAATSRGRCRCSSSQTGGSASSRSSSTPRRSSRSSGCRSRLDAVARLASPMNATSSTQLAATRAAGGPRSPALGRELQPRERVDRDRVGATRGRRRATSAVRARSAQTRSHSPGRSTGRSDRGSRNVVARVAPSASDRRRAGLIGRRR